MKKIISILLFCFCLNSCFRNEPAPISFNKIFEEISSDASNKNKPFCVVLTDSMQTSSKNYIKSLNEEYNYLRSKAIYNIVDINCEENNWYLKWLCPAFLPLTCVFSNEAKLIDIIPGATRETFLYSKEAIHNAVSTDFHWPNKFKNNKKVVIPFLNDVLEVKKYLDQGMYVPSKFYQMSDSLNYPYSLYLKLVGELMENDSISAKATAKSLLEFETPSALEVYKDEFITAKKVLNPKFDINAEPNIRVDTTVIFLNGCIINEKVPIDIAIYNDGENPLKISKIYLSCSCLEHVDSDKEIIIFAKKSHVAKFYFTPEEDGEIVRDIYITSNAINIPILHIHILAKTININN